MIQYFLQEGEHYLTQHTNKDFVTVSGRITVNKMGIEGLSVLLGVCHTLLADLECPGGRGRKKALLPHIQGSIPKVPFASSGPPHAGSWPVRPES